MAGQSAELWVDAAAAHARPPAGVPGLDASALAWAGGRLLVDRIGPVVLDLSAYGGGSAEAAGSRWVGGTLGARAARRIGAFSVDGRAELFGVGHTQPHAYRVHAFSFTPRVARAVGPFTVSARAEVTRGRWRFDGGPVGFAGELEGRLGLAGGGLALARPLGRAWVETSLDIYDATNGAADGLYTALGTSGRFAVGRADLSLGAAYWRTPAGNELGLDATVATQIADRLVAYARVERAPTDPLYGTPRDLTASFGVSWRVTKKRLARAMPVVELAEPIGRGRKVRFQLAGGVADRAAVAGSFTDWKPRPMQRAQDRWVLEVVLEPGIHHFGFVLDDGRWFVPDDAPGIVDDGWGQRNASLVIVEGR